MTKTKNKNKSDLYQKIFRISWITFATIILAIPIFFLTVRINLFNIYGGLPSVEELERPQDDFTSVIYSEDGQVLGKFYRYNRNPVDFEELSPYLIQALVSTEDRRFYDHSGIDPIGVVRAFVNYFVLQRNKEGGSTITQQLAKMLWDTRSDRYDGLISHFPFLNQLVMKTKEWIISIQIEQSYTKDEIIQMYFNTMPFGNNTFGIQTATRTYYDKDPDQLDLKEASLLVGVVNGPSLFNPLRNPERATRRRNWVLKKMHERNLLGSAELETLLVSGIDLNYNPEYHFEGPAPYLRSRLRTQLSPWARLNKYDLDKDGLRIYTTINSQMQIYAENAVRNHMKYLQKVFDQHWGNTAPWSTSGNGGEDYIQRAWRKSPHYQKLREKFGEDADTIQQIAQTQVQMSVFSWNGEKDTTMSPLDSIRYFKKFLHAGLLSMEPSSGKIKAWVGGINHKFFQYDHVKQGSNQPGSVFKPIVYATAIQNGYYPCYVVQDAPLSIPAPETPGGIWRPQNASRRFDGQKMTLRQALGRSVNRVAASMMSKVGPENVVELAQQLGITSHLEPVVSLSLGTSDVTLYEMAGVYAAFVNLGTWIEPWVVSHIEDRYGNVVFRSTPQTNEALSESTAYMMLYMLRGTVEEAGGTALGLSQYLKEDNQIAAKTGTTSNHADGWFMGATRDLVTGIWVGGDDRTIRFRTMEYGQGSRMAMPVWEDYMTHVYRDNRLDITKGPFRGPSQPIEVELNCAYYQPEEQMQEAKQTNQSDENISEEDIF